jgi:hypothetical protein
MQKPPQKGKANERGPQLTASRVGVEDGNPSFNNQSESDIIQFPFIVVANSTSENTV